MKTPKGPESVFLARIGSSKTVTSKAMKAELFIFEESKPEITYGPVVSWVPFSIIEDGIVPPWFTNRILPQEILNREKET